MCKFNQYKICLLFSLLQNSCAHSIDESLFTKLIDVKFLVVGARIGKQSNFAARHFN